MYKARKAQRKGEPMDTNLSWLLSKSGQDFVTNSIWKFGQSSFRLTQVQCDQIWRFFALWVTF